MNHRRPLSIGIAALAAVTLVTACGAPDSGSSATGTVSPGSIPDKPSKPVTLDILDVAGNLQLTQKAIDEFVEKNPDIVAKVSYEKATAPEMAGKVKAQQDAGRVRINLVLTGTDGLAAGNQQGLFTSLLPAFEDRLAGMDDYLEPAAKMQELARGNGVVVTYYPSGPLIEYLPAKVPNPPKTADELLAYAKAHPGKVGYARPANSGPGRTFLMGLPYVLGDTDPKDPVNGWTKTWAYLAELNKYVDTYPSTTSQTMKDLASGVNDIIVSTTGWDINPRALGTVPAEARTGTLQGFTWVTDAHYAVIPKGVSADEQAALLKLIAFILTPQQQAKAFDSGYFYPGPAIKDVTIDMAPADSQQVIKEFGRPEYDQLIEGNPKATPLDAKSLVAAFDRWDREIGGAKVKK
jgi:putative spermidine/putrescine transport system substrate-binding protein